MVKKKTFLTCVAGICWSIAAVIVIASLLWEEIREDNLYGRVCMLTGLAGAVVTSRIWNSRRVVHIPIEAEVVWPIAFQAGRECGKLEAKGALPDERPFTPAWAHKLRINGNTPPAGSRYSN